MTYIAVKQLEMRTAGNAKNQIDMKASPGKSAV